MRKEARVSVRGRLPRTYRAALVGAAHKLNYALLSCKSISVVIARGHMLDTFSQKIILRHASWGDAMYEVSRICFLDSHFF